MPKFITISPTHIPQKKEYAWNNFLSGNYIAIGWNHSDFSTKSINQIESAIREEGYNNEKEAILAHTYFLEIEIGDVVAVTNVNHGLFGIGIIKSDYMFQKTMHDTGGSDSEEYYSHYRKVEWMITEYQSRGNLLYENEKCWQTRGTIGKLDFLPKFVIRNLELHDITIKLNSIDWDGDQEVIGYEGKKHQEFKLHKWIERDINFVRAYKWKYRDIKKCEGCEMDPEIVYNIQSIDFFELHHLYPLSLRKSNVSTITKEDDVVLLCPNCHKFIHKLISNSEKGMITLTELKEKRNNIS